MGFESARGWHFFHCDYIGSGRPVKSKVPIYGDFIRYRFMGLNVRGPTVCWAVPTARPSSAGPHGLFRLTKVPIYEAWGQVPVHGELKGTHLWGGGALEGINWSDLTRPEG